MKLGKRTLALLAMVLCLVVSAAPFQSQAAEKKVAWRLASCWGEGNLLLEVDKRFATLVAEFTDGNFIIDVHPAGQLGSSNQVFDLVANGVVEAGADWPGYWAGKNTAFDLLASTMDDFSNLDYYIWIYEGGGLEDSYKYLYGKYNILGLPISVTTAESGLRSTKPINTLADMKGMKIRMSGKLQGFVAQKIGFTPVTVDANELYESLQRGVIDAAEFSGPAADDSIKLQEVAKFWLTPGWHQSAAVNCALINMDAYKALPDKYKEALVKAARMCCGEWLAKKVWDDSIIVRKMVEEQGVKTTKFPPADMEKLSAYVREGVKAMCAENPDYKKVHDSMQAYRAVVGPYRKILDRYGFGFNFSE